MALANRLRSVFPFWVATCLVVSPFFVFPLVSGAHFYDNQRLIEYFLCAIRTRRDLGSVDPGSSQPAAAQPPAHAAVGAIFSGGPGFQQHGLFAAPCIS